MLWGMEVSYLEKGTQKEFIVSEGQTRKGDVHGEKKDRRPNRCIYQQDHNADTKM